MLEEIVKNGYIFELTNSGGLYHIMIANPETFDIDDIEPTYVMTWTGTDMKKIIENAMDYVIAVS